MDIAMVGMTACLPRRHFGTATVTAMDTAAPCMSLKIIQDDLQPALLARLGTTGLFSVTQPLTCPNEAWVS